LLDEFTKQGAKMDDPYEITIYPLSLNGKKTTSKGKTYFEVVDNNKQKFRVYEEGLYNRLKVGQSYNVKVSDFSGSFTNEKGVNVDYTIKTIHNLLSVPLDDQEPLDKALMDSNKELTKAINEDLAQHDNKPDWDAIAEGKVRHGVATAVIAQLGLVELTDEMVDLMEDWVKYIMSGKDWEGKT